MEIPEEMIETLVPAVREQLESPDTAYVKNCLERLTGREKLEEQEALELMAQALAITINAMMVGGRPFDSGKYKALLKDLPTLPDEAP
ncbi:hypothetical protein [Akkermansia muciniphila]|uniref:hypothetical protein n=1 Tax=Akkermansia muciniphila TaxID=239935 RepID=UPI000B8E7289|nr:hypothetical protein [Akkermansia muciniphila]